MLVPDLHRVEALRTRVVAAAREWAMETEWAIDAATLTTATGQAGLALLDAVHELDNHVDGQQQLPLTWPR
jgi:hypothetical protein